MVLRLVLDAVRRTWRMGALAVFQLYFLFKALGRIWPSSEGMAWTMAGASVLSIFAGELFRSRVLYQLPVSRRAWWLTRWWLAVTAPVIVAQLAVSLAQWSARSQRPGVEQAVLFMIFGVLCCGSIMALQTTSLGKSAEAPATFGSVGVSMLAMLGLLVGLLVLAPYFPHTFADMQATSVVVMLAMAVLTAVGYRHDPAIEPRPYLRVARQSAPVPSAAPAVLASPPGVLARLTGAKLVLWEECRKQFVAFSVVIAAGVAYWAVASRIRPLPALDECLRLASVLPFSSPRAPITEPIVFGGLLIVANLVEQTPAAGIRSLRALPLSSTRLGGLPVGLGLVSSSMLWIVLLTLHGLVLRTLPVSLRPDLFVAFAALTAMTRTIRFTAPGPPPAKAMLGLTPVAVVWLALGFTDSWPVDIVQSGMLIGGLVTLAACWAVMRYALVHSSSMYRDRAAAARFAG